MCRLCDITMRFILSHAALRLFMGVSKSINKYEVYLFPDNWHDMTFALSCLKSSQQNWYSNPI